MSHNHATEFKEPRFIFALILTGLIFFADQAISQTAEIMDTIKDALYEQFDIDHTTIQFECGDCGQGVIPKLEE